MNDRVGQVLGIPVSLAPHQVVMDDIARRIAERQPGGVISITNTESMYHALHKSGHMRYICAADHSLCDGVGVIAAGWFWGLRIERYNGPVLQLDCSRDGVPRQWRHFYFGGKEGVAELMTEKLKARFPGLQVVGSFCPPFRPMTVEEDRALVEQINAAQPDFVWVGLGLLKQEQWIADHVGRINAPWMVGVGAAFDYHSGAVPWAPRALRALGLEWLFRLIIQPRLRARRYWWSLLFVLRAAAQGLFSGAFFRQRPARR
jgi:N-acetylglucosaminyldiphosphoundecaprenol N-acetyl-beta-D-mannosaminyltransferase